MKVLLIVIDAATPRVVCPAVRTGRLPFLQRLAAAGSMYEASVTIFPSITPAATTSIITGEYPAAHGIAGASWYDRDTGDIAYYGDDFWTVAREGFGHFLRDFLVRLNGDRLVAPTLFETVEDAGLTAACLNYLVFRGRVRHRVNIPWLLTVLPGVPLTETIYGPRVCCLGDFVSTRTKRGRRLREKGGPLHRFGMDDASAGAMLCELMQDGNTPDLTVTYFPDNDFRGHDVGPYESLAVIEKVDAMLHQAVEAGGGLERVLAETCIIVTSDHGHCEVLDDRDRSVIRLDEVLEEFGQAVIGRGWQPGEDLLICPNMRAAQIYVNEPSRELVQRIVRRSLEHPGVDQVIWHAPLAGGGQGEYVVATARGELRFRRSEQDAGSHDAYGTGWTWDGDDAVLGIGRDGREVTFGEYPNAFERIAGVFEAERSGELWATAQPGCEFEVPGGSAHAGGASHGALHAFDSLSPVIAAGLPAGRPLPGAMRSVDLAPLCSELLGVPSPVRPGDARPHRTLVRPSYVSRGA